VAHLFSLAARAPGESEIRKWIIENDWLEAIIALPEQMFYNTGIGTYIWIVTNRKEKRRKRKIQLLDARDIWTPGGSEESKRALGDKRRHLTSAHVEQIVQLYGRFENGDRSKIFDNDDFGYTRVTVERPLRLRYQMTDVSKSRFVKVCPALADDIQAIDDACGRAPERNWNVVWPRIQNLIHSRGSRWKSPEQKLFRTIFTESDPDAEPVAAGKANEPDPALRECEIVPLKEDIVGYFEREVKPHVFDAWMDHSKDTVGYEINFNRYFYKYAPPRPLEEIDSDLKRAEEDASRLLNEVMVITRSLTSGVNSKVELRESGVSWLDKIPANWKTLRAAWLFRERDERGEPELPLLEVSINAGVALREFSNDQIENTAADFNTYKVARKGDIVFNKMRMWQGAVGVAPEDGLVSPDYVVAAPTGNLSTEYAGLLFRIPAFSAECGRRSHGIVWDRLRLYWEDFREIQLPVPPPEEQTAIVTHIASKSALFDGSGAAAQRTITLLRERRAALIAAAVTGQIEIGATAEAADA